jgi:hypothetical protein
LRLVEPRSGPTPKRRSSNTTSASLTDPDAKLRHKPGQRPHLVHRGQVAVDPQARCVVACLGEQADGHEVDALVAIIERARFAYRRLESLGTDQGYAAERVWDAVGALGITAYVPPERTMLPAADEDPKTSAQAAAKAACERCKTPAGVWSYSQRMGDAEGVVGELKRQHGMDRARSRGTHSSICSCCSAARLLNLKRIATHTGQAASAAAAGPRTAKTDPDRIRWGSRLDQRRERHMAPNRPRPRPHAVSQAAHRARLDHRALAQLRRQTGFLDRPLGRECICADGRQLAPYRRGRGSRRDRVAVGGLSTFQPGIDALGKSRWRTGPRRRSRVRVEGAARPKTAASRRRSSGRRSRMC